MHTSFNAIRFFSDSISASGEIRQKMSLVRWQGPSRFCWSRGKWERSGAKDWQPVLLPDLQVGP